MFYVYVLFSTKDQKLYTGYTKDLRNRLREHNQGYNFSTNYRRPLKLVYYEASTEKGDCVAREKYLKSGPGKRFLKNRLRRFLKSNLVTGFGPATGSP